MSRRAAGWNVVSAIYDYSVVLADGTSLRRTARELDLCYATLRT